MYARTPLKPLALRPEALAPRPPRQGKSRGLGRNLALIVACAIGLLAAVNPAPTSGPESVFRRASTALERGDTLAYLVCIDPSQRGPYREALRRCATRVAATSAEADASLMALPEDASASDYLSIIERWGEPGVDPLGLGGLSGRLSDLRYEDDRAQGFVDGEAIDFVQHGGRWYLSPGRFLTEDSP